MVKQPRKYYWATVFGLVVLFVVMAGRMVVSARGSSATTDEAIHILSGYLADRNGDFRLNPEHPFLGKMIAASPHVFLKTPLPDLTQFYAVAGNFYYDSWSETRDTAVRWLYQSGLDPQQILWPSRLMAICVTVLAGFLLSLWSLKRFGSVGALIVGVFYTLDPTILAHGQLANTDYWATIGFVGTLLTFLSYAEKPTVWRLVGLAAMFGVAMNLKFSLILLLPILAVLWVVAKWKFKCPIASYPFGFAAIVVGWIVVSILVDLRGISAVPVLHLSSLNNVSAQLLLLAPFSHFLFPAQYWKGLVMVILGTVGGRTAYLMGHIGIGWWYYFPVAFAIKETVVMVLSFIALAIIGLLRIKKWSLMGWTFAVAITVYWLAAMSSHLTLGIRHLLPIMPVIMLAVAAGVSAWFKTAKNAQRTLALVGILLAACSMAWTTAKIHPFYLSYFNEFIGGPINGQKYLADSNLDWGQDLGRLGSWLSANQVSGPILLSYEWTGNAAPGHYGISFVTLTPETQQQAAFVAISRSELVSNPGYAWLRSQTPTGYIGYSIALYDHRTVK